MNSYSLKIPPLMVDNVKSLFLKHNAVFDIVQYSLWRAKTPSFQAILYSSGKLLIQGKDISKIAAEIDELLGIKQNNITTTNSLSLELNNNSLIETNGEKYIGTDESGKGDFFGPLVVAGVQSNDDNNKKFTDLGIKDSKKLDDFKILKFADFIKANAIHSVIVITPIKYNELYNKFNNLNKLLAWAHARAIENILEKSPCNFALADKFGDESLIKNALMHKGKNITLFQSVRAEADITVAAASILARAEFVKRMQHLSTTYDINLSKGVNPSVISQANEFIHKYSYSRLNEIAKLHFKTYKELNIK